jgi:2-oxoglutarate dehydrogenase E2 component (dihydrolipoamide succinyltransferase)
LLKDGDYVEKTAIAEVDSDKATLELPAEASGIITLKAEEGDAAVGAVVCRSIQQLLNHLVAPAAAEQHRKQQKLQKQKLLCQLQSSGLAATYASGTPSPAARKILDEKKYCPAALTGTGKDGRITKEDAVNAVPSMELLQEEAGQERTKLSIAS